MRLLHSKTMKLKEFMGDGHVPPYAILSHTWGEDEVTYQEMVNSNFEGKAGYTKIRYCCQQAIEDDLEWVWVDTCCIDKSSSAELSEAINSMFRWYQRAEVCYAYLSDVSYPRWPESKYLRLSKCRWFTRGWTLQELVAPADVVFYSKDWKNIGTKKRLCKLLVTITGINWDTLQGEDLELVSVASRMSWAARRTTTRVEDMAYCLLGIFDINMPLLYGEGKKAFLRLQEEILKVSADQSLFAWRSKELLVSFESFIKDEQDKLSHDNSQAPDTGIQDRTISSSLLRGLFANEPSEFSNSQFIVPVKKWTVNRNGPPLAYNRGIRIDLPVLDYPELNLKFAILGCESVSAYNFYLAIPMKKWADGEFLGRLRRLVLVPADKFQTGTESSLQELVQTLQVKEETPTRKGLDGCVVVVEVPSRESGFSLVGSYCVPSSSYENRTRIFRPRKNSGGPQLLLVFEGQEDIAFVVVLGQIPVSRRRSRADGAAWFHIETTKKKPSQRYEELMGYFAKVFKDVNVEKSTLASLNLVPYKRYVLVQLETQVMRHSVTEKVTVRVADEPSL